MNPLIYVALVKSEQNVTILSTYGITEKTTRLSLVCSKAVNTNPNVYSTFKSHKSQKHSFHTLVDFKDGIVQVTCLAGTEEPDVSNNNDNNDCVDSQSDDVELDTLKDQLAIVEN